MTDKNYFAEVQGFLRLESEAIAQTAARLQADEIERVVQLLAALPGQNRDSGSGQVGNHRAKNCGDDDQHRHRRRFIFIRPTRCTAASASSIRMTR